MDDIKYFEELKRFNVSRETFDAFVNYKHLLIKWQKQINLVSNDSIKDFWQRHLMDSLQLVKYTEDASRILDVGSGGGFPGAVIAIYGKSKVVCVESDFRKTCFLRTLFSHLHVQADVINDRVESYLKTDSQFDCVTARGFAKLSVLLNFVEVCGATGVFLKGKNVEQELSEAKEIFSFDYKLNKSETGEDGFVLVIKKCRRKQ